MSKRGGRGGRGAVSYIKQDEPAFLKRFKQKAGYVEGPDVNTKREQLPERDEDEPELDDEKPQVVVLSKGDLTAEEAEALGGFKPADDEDDEPPADGRVVFKKPKKRSSDSDVNTASSTSKKKKEKHSDSGNSKKNKVKAIKNTKLLSFGDEEEEDD